MIFPFRVPPSLTYHGCNPAVLCLAVLCCAVMWTSGDLAPVHLAVLWHLASRHLAVLDVEPYVFIYK